MFALPFIIIIDLLVLNGSLYLCSEIGMNILPQKGMLIINMLYIICVLSIRPVSHRRFVRVESVASKSFETSIVFFAIFALLAKMSTSYNVNDFQFCLVAIITAILLFCGRVTARAIIKTVRKNGRGARRILFVGAGFNLGYLYSKLKIFLDKSFIFMGYFDEEVSDKLPKDSPYLGKIADLIPWLESLQDRKPNIIYCNLPSSRSEEIIELINYCENHLIQFYSVPNVRNYVHHTMRVKMIDDMPVLALRDEPLRNSFNKFLKRGFDIVFSTLFLVTCFWWIYIIVAIITKITMPGPVFFVQKRNGILNKEFSMIKFRSMKVNTQADTLQATKDDPRKTKWGNLMRKTSIDELPQFINVFLGDMSVVGPRPHMVKHTEEYSAVINKYMVRHWIKPGITGFAQVMGARGETEELWQMEDRIKKDIWYVEHWSIWLDFRIIIKTITNAIGGDKQAY